MGKGGKESEEDERNERETMRGKQREKKQWVVNELLCGRGEKWTGQDRTGEEKGREVLEERDQQDRRRANGSIPDEAHSLPHHCSVFSHISISAAISLTCDAPASAQTSLPACPARSPWTRRERQWRPAVQGNTGRDKQGEANRERQTGRDKQEGANRIGM